MGPTTFSQFFWEYRKKKSTVFCLVEYLILKKQETGTEHVAIATSKCVPTGRFCRVQHACQVSITLLCYWWRYC